jgi:hypothetical protein
MSKKSSKKRRIQRVNVPRESAEAARRDSSAPVNLAEQYSYVINDLLRMAILAAVLIAVLIGLSFFL